MKIYGNKLKELEKKIIIDGKVYPLQLKNITLFPLEHMIEIADLSINDSEFLKKHSTRNYDYEFKK